MGGHSQHAFVPLEGILVVVAWPVETSTRPFCEMRGCPGDLLEPEIPGHLRESVVWGAVGPTSLMQYT